MNGVTLTAITLIATPLLAFAGAGVGHWIRWRSVTDLDRWRKREESMRMVRWAVEIAGDADQSHAHAGIVVLRALMSSDLLDSRDVALVDAVTAVVRPESGQHGGYTENSTEEAE